MSSDSEGFYSKLIIHNSFESDPETSKNHSKSSKSNIQLKDGQFKGSKLNSYLKKVYHDHELFNMNSPKAEAGL